MTNLTDELAQFFYKWSHYIIGTAVGVIGKISFEMGMKRKLTIFQWFGIVGVSIFVGYLISVTCEARGLQEHSGYLVPIGTLLGEKILIYLTNNYHDIIGRILGLFKRNKNEQNHE